MNYEEIRDSIKKSGRRIFWYDSKGKLLVVDSSKSSSRKKVLKKKYEGVAYRLSITFHREKTLGQGGPLAVHCRKFIIEDGKIIKEKGYSNGIIWFEKNYLNLMKEWNEDWLDLIAKKLIKGYRFVIGIHHFENMF